MTTKYAVQHVRDKFFVNAQGGYAGLVGNLSPETGSVFNTYNDASQAIIAGIRSGGISLYSASGYKIVPVQVQYTVTEYPSLAT